MRVRDLPIAGRVTVPAVAQAPLWLRGVRAHVHRDAPGAAGASARQRAVSRAAVRALPRRRRARRGRARGADHPLSGRARVRAGARRARGRRATSAPPRRLSLDEAHHRRGRELATVVSDLDRRRVIEVLDGRSRRRVERYLRALPDRRARARSRSSRSTPTTPTAKRSAPSCRTRGSSSTTSTWSAAPTPRWTPSAASANAPSGARRPKGTRRSGHHARWRPELYHARHRLLKARERLTERERRRLSSCSPTSR